MIKKGKEILSRREGTSQAGRFLDALDPGSVKLNDMGLKEWMRFAYNFARHVNYFDVTESDTPSGDWTAFFKSDAELENFIRELESRSDVTPHLALFVSFVKLLELTKKRFNGLTSRHLDFYYKEVLKFEKEDITPDKVHVIFELAKNAVSVRIPEGTELKAGKDALGKDLIFKTTEELVANRIKVAQLKNVYHSPEKRQLKYAPVANSFDGQGSGFPEGETGWWPFGYPEADAGTVSDGYPSLPDARPGFAIASDIFYLKEGDRSIMLAIDFEKPLEGVGVKDLTDNIEVFVTGKKGWIGPFSIKEVVRDLDGNTIFSSGVKTSGKRLELAFRLTAKEEEVNGYSRAVHGENFTTDRPVCRILVDTGSIAGYSLFSALSGKKVSKLSVKVDVRNIKSAVLGSDTGKLNPEKPFYPFGTQPVKGSAFTVSYPEINNKRWTGLNFKIHWNNTPDSFKDLYYAYRDSNKYNISLYSFLEALGSFSVSESSSVKQENPQEKSQGIVPAWLLLSDAKWAGQVPAQIFNPEEKDLIVTDDSYFKVLVELKKDKKWKVLDSSKELFTKLGAGYITDISVNNSATETGECGEVKLVLKQSFLQEMFPRIYALAMSSKEENVIIPNEPYVPLAGSITLSYSAEAALELGENVTGVATEDIVLFREHPFGQAVVSTEDDKDAFVMPRYPRGGELYIGLKGAGKKQQVSMLIEVLEGSENPLTESFGEGEKTEWSVLGNNRWITVGPADMIKDGTDNFLRSGIVKFSIPSSATTDNTLLHGGLVWVRARMDRNFDAVCKVLSISAQAVEAEFENRNNDTSHLKNGLKAGTVSKLVNGIPGIKGVAQPFSSFGGKAAETDKEMYRRISERLRHKNRAVTLWDYEHLILERFPDIYKVKLLNHTRVVNSDGKVRMSFLSPGNVAIVVIPDIVNKNVFDIYQPRVSKTTLNYIQDFVNGLNGLHVKATVINPFYEEVLVDMKVKFRKGYDESFYANILNNDLVRLLSPWAFENYAAIDFGTVLHRSRMISYAEQLEYVDYVEDLKLWLNGRMSTTSVAPSNPASILVSAREHDIKGAEQKCNS